MKALKLPEDLDLDYTVFCDEKAGVWRQAVTEANFPQTENFGPVYEYDKLISEADCELLKAFRNRLKARTSVGSCDLLEDGNYYGVLAFVEQHEELHLKHIREFMASEGQLFLQALNRTTIPLFEARTSLEAGSLMIYYNVATTNQFIAQYDAFGAAEKAHGPDFTAIDLRAHEYVTARLHAEIARRCSNTPASTALSNSGTKPKLTATLNGLMPSLGKMTIAMQPLAIPKAVASNEELISTWLNRNFVPLEKVVDDQWTFSVNGQSRSVPQPYVMALTNISAPDEFGAGGPGSPRDFVSDDYVRVVGHSTKGGINRYASSPFLKIRRGETVPFEDCTFTDTPPKKPDMLAAVPGRDVVPRGEMTQLTVTATYANKSTGIVTPATSWTSYRTSNAAVAKVNANGLVTTVSAGTAYITAVNEGVAAVARVDVSLGNAVTTVIGFVRAPDGAPAVGATVEATGAPPVVVAADGSFEINIVPAIFSTITVIARWTQGGVQFEKTIELATTPGGTSDAGILTVVQIGGGIPAMLLYTIPGPFGTPQAGAGQVLSVAVDGDIVAVGTPYDDIGVTGSGVVKVYDTTSLLT